MTSSIDRNIDSAADRIQARAIRRCGELLRQVPAGEGARDGKRQDANVPPLNRSTVASSAGLSERQRKTALRVAAVPEPAFTRQVESESPPTVTALAKQGTAAKRLIGELSQSLETSQGARTELCPIVGTKSKREVFVSAGISKSEAHRCEQLVAMPATPQQHVRHMQADLALIDLAILRLLAPAQLLPHDQEVADALAAVLGGGGA